MQLMADAVAVLGSRHGLMWNPPGRSCAVVRFDRFTRMPAVEIRAGAVIGGRTLVLPLCPEGEGFSFLDQRMTPCTMTLMGIDGESNIKVTLTVTTPFRPRDAEFSTTPVLGLRLEAEQLPGIFRWEPKTVIVDAVELFLEISGPEIGATASGVDSVDLTFDSVRGATWEGMTDVWDDHKTTLPQRDRLVVTSGERVGTGCRRTVTLAQTEPLDVAWCTWSAPVIEVRGESYAFKYAEQFAGLDAVADWARANPTALCDNTARVDGIVSRNNASAATNSLLAQTLHTWLCCTWYGTRGDGLAGSRRSDRDWYGVWEGSCYLMSTVDVEYTQAPFYLAVWPELLRLQLDHWPHYARDGRVTLGERGAGTAFLCHDSGGHATANGNVYSHDMEVEENANYIILAYAYWRRTGDDGPLQRHGEAIGQYLEFLARCDTTGNGVPDRGVANTIDDASPAVQFGREQMYLGAKTLAAFVAGSVILRHLGREPEAQRFDVQAGVLRGTLETAGWLGDHFATLLEKRGVLKNPWSGEEIPCEEIPGWDAAHIYTVNGLALLDMVGLDTGLDRDKLTTDLHTATARCLREYGCVHSDFANTEMAQLESMLGLVGVARAPGWIAMNLLRDIAAFYRGVDLRGLAERYWNWQTTTNTQEPKLFFETFAGNNLCFYPRGIAAWGYFDALGGVVIDRVASVDARGPAFSQTRVPVLLTADWANGTSEVVEG